MTRHRSAEKTAELLALCEEKARLEARRTEISDLLSELDHGNRHTREACNLARERGLIADRIRILDREVTYTGVWERYRRALEERKALEKIEPVAQFQPTLHADKENPVLLIWGVDSKLLLG